MASVFFRGSGAARRWFARYKAPDGAWRARRVRGGDARRGPQDRARASRAKPSASALRSPRPSRRLRRARGRPPGALGGGARQPLGLRRPLAPQEVDRPEVGRSASLGRHPRDGHALARRAVGVRTRAAPQTQRHLLGILSRFFSWAIERGHAHANPCRMIPGGKRPRGAPEREVPWIDDDAAREGPHGGASRALRLHVLRRQQDGDAPRRGVRSAPLRRRRSWGRILPREVLVQRSAEGGSQG